MNRFLIGCLLALVSSNISAQDLHYTRTGKILFHAGTSLEDIDGTNNEVASIINIKTGEIAFTVLVKSFHFRRTLMEEHFNENYMESNKLPKANFSGKITNIGIVDSKKDGKYDVNVEGDLTIHGVTKKISVPGTITVAGGKIAAQSTFKIKVEDYNIKIPGVVASKISEQAEINIDCRYEPRT